MHHPDHPDHPKPSQAGRRVRLRRRAASGAAIASMLLATLWTTLWPAAAAAAPTRAADPSTAALLAGPAAPTPAPDTAWWRAFDDATLNLLVHWAEQREAGLQPLLGQPAQQAADSADELRREVVAAYIGTRVLSARWLALGALGEAAARQLALLNAAAPGKADGPTPRQALRAELEQRADQVARLQQALALERATLLQRLAARCGLPPAQLTELLAPALAQSTVPQFGSAVPPKLPRSILRARPDVAAAEAGVLRALRTAGHVKHGLILQMVQTGGWIEPSAAPPSPAAAEPGHGDETRPELDTLTALLTSAEQEVAQDLRSLSERARLQAERAQRTDASRQAFLAARERLKAGEQTEWQVLEQYQVMLAESDRHASACGELAMAWLRLVASTGASAQVLAPR